MMVTRDELLAVIGPLAAATNLPLNVDSERCFADDLAGVTGTVELLADAGTAGCSIEDWNPVTNAIDPLAVAVDRDGAAAAGAARAGLVLTARSENTLHGVNHLDDTTARLQASTPPAAAARSPPGRPNPGHVAADRSAVPSPRSPL